MAVLWYSRMVQGLKIAYPGNYGGSLKMFKLVGFSLVHLQNIKENFENADVFDEEFNA